MWYVLRSQHSVLNVASVEIESALAWYTKTTAIDLRVREGESGGER